MDPFLFSCIDGFGKYVLDSLTWQEFEKPESIREIFWIAKFSSSIKLHVNLVRMITLLSKKQDSLQPVSRTCEKFLGFLAG